MFIFSMVIAIIALSAFIIFMLIELNAVEQEGKNQIRLMKKRYGEAE